jgi:septal ring factor EnvC (AmiA/AmiB activator)
LALDWYQIAALIISLLFGGQGVLAWIKSRRAKAQGLPRTEEEAKKKSPSQYLTEYYQGELEVLRGNQGRELESVRQELARVRRRLDNAEKHIDDLEAHIWQGKPPPPPKRRAITESREKE